MRNIDRLRIKHDCAKFAEAKGLSVKLLDDSHFWCQNQNTQIRVSFREIYELKKVGWKVDEILQHRLTLKERTL